MKKTLLMMAVAAGAMLTGCVKNETANGGRDERGRNNGKDNHSYDSERLRCGKIPPRDCYVDKNYDEQYKADYHSYGEIVDIITKIYNPTLNGTRV